jgi:glycerol-3-phosphate cytidylyltransferase-like family protein
MELDHPMQVYKDKPLSPERIQNISYDRRCAVIKKPRRVGNLLKATIETTNNDLGEGLAKDIIAHGYQPMASCRAIANIVNRGRKPYVMVKRLITYDTVNYASHIEADSDKSSMNTVVKDINISVNESTTTNIKTTIDDSAIMFKDVMIPLKDILESIGKTDVNAQIIMESFEIDPKNLIGFNRDNTQMIMKDSTNNMIYANISRESTKKINDFFASF